MKKILNIVTAFILICQFTYAQDAVKPASPGFDTVRAVPHGKIDSITYSSKTVGTNRKALKI